MTSAHPFDAVVDRIVRLIDENPDIKTDMSIFCRQVILNGRVLAYRHLLDRELWSARGYDDAPVRLTGEQSTSIDLALDRAEMRRRAKEAPDHVAAMMRRIDDAEIGRLPEPKPSAIILETPRSPWWRFWA